MQPMLIIHMESKGINENDLQTAFDDMFDEGMDQIEKELERVWREKASSTLKTSKEDYLNGLSVERTGNDIQFVLKGALPIALEEGAPSYDMKPGLLKNLTHRTIPINSKTSNPVFRQLSTKSKGWIHPGFKPRKIHEEVMDEAEAIYSKVFEELVSRISV